MSDTETITYLAEKILEFERDNAFHLATAADCMSPDFRDSDGAKFLSQVRDDTLEQVNEILTRTHWEDEFPEIADRAVPIYTHHLWKVFVDLGAYQEDVTELGCEADDLTKCAQVALYMIAERLARFIGEELREAHENDEDETCAEDGCEERADDGEGYDGLCGTHADQAEEA